MARIAQLVVDRTATPKTPRRAKKPSAAKGSKPSFDLTPCALDYFRALYNPFDLNLNPCIPGITPTPSMKFKSMARGTFQVGTQGVGGVAFWPFRMISKTNLTNNVANVQYPAIIATNNTYAGADYSFTNANSIPLPTPGDLAAYVGTTSIFDAVSLGGYSGGAFTQSNRTAKLVGAGIRVQYVDKVLDMSGDFITWRNPNPTTQVAGTVDTVADLLSNNAASMERVSERWTGVSYIPILETDLGGVAEPGLATVSMVGGVGGRLAAGVFIANAQPGQRFAFEAVAYFEIAGTGIASTASHSDPHALGAILSINTPIVIPDMDAAERTAYSLLRDNVIDMGYAGLKVLGSAMGSSLANSALRYMGGVRAEHRD